MTTLLSLLVAHALAHEVRVPDMIDIHANVQECLDLTEKDERIDCYTHLCDPNYNCVVSLVIKATKELDAEHGTVIVRDTVGHPLYSFEENGHELMHFVGRETAKKEVSAESFLSCPGDFTYGCYHGFFEQALSNRTAVDAAVDICDGTQTTELDRFQCYHGVGHGVMMAQGNNIQKSLTTCDRLPDELSQYGCHQGVFMENINVYNDGGVRHGVFRRDPLAPCNTLSLVYQKPCYEYHPAYLMDRFKGNFKKAAKACLRAEPTRIGRCIGMLGQLAADPEWQNAMKMHSATSNVRSEVDVNAALELCNAIHPNAVHACHMGAVIHMVNFSWYNEAVSYCSQVASEHVSSCFQSIANTHMQNGREKSLLVDICTATESKDCTNGNEDLSIDEPIEIDTSLFSKILSPFRSLYWNINDWYDDRIHSVSKPIKRRLALKDLLSKKDAITIKEKEATILFDGFAYSPNKLIVQKGTTIHWENLSPGEFWPASDVHPTHELLPEFDAGHPQPSGSVYSFTFKDKGAWTFHDHLFPQAVGVVFVK